MRVSSAESRRPLIPLLGALAISVALLVLPFPGSLSVQVTRAAALTFGGTPGIELVSELPLVALAVAAAAAVSHALWTRPPRRLVAMSAAIGVFLAYSASEGLKLAAAQPRPCAVWNLAGDCPPAGDWSFPSNHATLAFAAVVVIAVTTRSVGLACVATLLAVVVAAGRVLEGFHYLHDVAAGAAVGILTVGVAVLATVHGGGRLRGRAATPVP